jgi:hypothetical protein
MPGPFFSSRSKGNQMKLRVALLATTAALLALCVAAVPGASAAKRSSAAKLTVTKVGVLNQKVTVRGKVKLPAGKAKLRKRTRVVLTLTDAAGKRDRFKARLGAKRRFAVSHTTKLEGAVTLRARVTIKGKASGKTFKRKLTVAPPAAAGVLNGTFTISAGNAPAGKEPNGSWFQMLTPSGPPLTNGTSPAENDLFTPLTGGTDGGLRTDVYQPPPSPAFVSPAGGNALASRIIRPVSFFNTDFSIVTAAIDPQEGLADPLPSIYQENGRLSGQITAWAAQWNGQSFNQGSPKPNGSLPPPTSPVSGTFDGRTRRYTLNWHSRIAGGPFNSFTGAWHLEGTFEPAS